MEELTIRIKKLREDVEIPKYQTEGAAGFDLTADKEKLMYPGQMAVFGTGLAFAIPEGYEGECRPRSGTAFKHGITLINSPGTIDSDYRGEVKVCLVHHGLYPYRVKKGQRICQMLIKPVVKASLIEVDELDDTARGSGGFGHTG